MKLLLPPAHDKTRHHLPPEALREFNALKVTAFDPERFPILAKHWPGPMIVGDQLVCNDDSPLARRFETVPVVEIKEPNGADTWRNVGDVADRVYIAPEGGNGLRERLQAFKGIFPPERA